MKQKQIVFLALLIFLFACPFFTFAANVDSNLTSCGQPLDDTNRTYVLQNDVVSNGTCFTISKQHVTLDLNGKTITYDNAAPIVIPNAGFETGDFSSWDTSHAPNASIEAGSYVLPRSLYSGSYSVKFHLTEASSQTPNDQYIRSIVPITLEANTAYSLSAMFANSGNSDTAENDYHDGGKRDLIKMAVEFEGIDGSNNAVPGIDSSGNPISVINTTWDTTDVPAIAPGTVLTEINGHHTGVTWRSFQYSNKIFTTGNAPLTAYVVLRVSNVPVGSNGYVYMDDVKISKYRNFGVDIGPNYAASQYATIHGGSIIQGQGNSFESHAINSSESSNHWNLNFLDITTSGVNSKAFFSFYGDTSQDPIPVHSTFNNNTIHHNVSTIKSRDNYDGAAVHVAYHADGFRPAGCIDSSCDVSGANIFSNTITNGLQTGLNIAHTSGKPANNIYSNNVTLQTKYTNDFAIAAGGSNVYGNTVNCGSGNNSCRGITIGGIDTKVYGNTISVQQLPRNQEYNGCQPPGAYAMQGEYMATNVEVYGNIVVANAGNATTGSGVNISCNAAALRLNPDPGNETSMNIHDNTFTANSVDPGTNTTTGKGRSTGMLLGDITSPLINIHDNIFEANSRWLVVDYATSNAMTMTMNGNTFKTIAPLDSTFLPFETGIANANFTFAGNKYGTVDDKTRFESEFFRNSFGVIMPTSSITILPSSDVTAPSAPSGLSVL